MSTHRKPLEPWRPGSWVQGRLTHFDTTALTLLLVGLALVRAWDYATPPPWVPADPHYSPGLAVVETAGPLWLWIGWLITGASVLLVGAVLRIHLAVWVGHFLLATVYAGFAVGFSLEYWAQPWADGIRSAGPMWTIAALHLLIATRTGWRPPLWIPQPRRTRL